MQNCERKMQNCESERKTVYCKICKIIINDHMYIDKDNTYKCIICDGFGFYKCKKCSCLLKINNVEDHLCYKKYGEDIYS